MAVTLVSEGISVHFQATTPKTMAGVAMQAGDLLLVWQMYGSASNAFPTAPSLSGGPTVGAWSSRDTTGATNQFSRTKVWWATVATGGTATISATASATGGAENGAGYVLLRGALAVEGDAELAVSSNQTGSSLAVAGVAAGSDVFYFGNDWTANNGVATWRTIDSVTPTVGNGGVLREFGDGINYAYRVARWANVGTGGTVTTGYTNLTVRPAGVAMEITPVVAVPATAAGQYGWGTYGAGDYGPNFGGAASTPISGTESFAMSEGASVLVVQQDRADSWALTDASSPAASLAALDSWSLTDIAALSQQLLVAANDAWVTGEGASSLADTLSASESHSQVEGSTLLQGNYSAVDVFTLAELSAILATMSTSDNWSLTEVAAAAVTLSQTATDAATLSDASALIQTSALSVTDAWIAGESALVSASLPASESHAQAEGVTLLQMQSTGTDSNTLSEAVAMATALDASETHTLGEIASTGADQQIQTSDSLALTDASALAVNIITSDLSNWTEGVPQIGLTAADGSVVADLGAVMGLFTRSDAWATDETLNLVSSLGLSDNATFTDVLSVGVTLARTDAWSVGEVSAVTSSLSASDAASLVEFVNAVGSQDDIFASDSAAQAEAPANLAVVTLVAASDSYTMTEAVVLSATLARSESMDLSEAASLLANLPVNDTYVFADAASTGSVEQLSASDGLSLADASSIQVALALTDALTLSEALSLVATATVIDSADLEDDASLGLDFRLIAVTENFLVIEYAEAERGPGPVVVRYGSGWMFGAGAPNHPFSGIGSDQLPPPRTP